MPEKEVLMCPNEGRCAAHAGMESLMHELKAEVLDLRKAMQTLRNTGYLVVGTLLGTGILQVKSLLTVVGLQ